MKKLIFNIFKENIEKQDKTPYSTGILKGVLRGVLTKLYLKLFLAYVIVGPVFTQTHNLSF